jgi:hypothetical protein
MDHSKMEHVMTDSGMVMIMDGIPGWLFGSAVGAVILVSFVLVEWRGIDGASAGRIELASRRRGLRWALQQRWFQIAFQAPVIAGFLFVIYAGLIGDFATNIAPILTWTIWWAGLIFAVALFGNLWCFLCPWDGIASLVSRLSLWKKKPSLSLGLPTPGWLETLWPAIALFIGLTWLELGFGITNNSRQTAYVALAMIVAAIVFALLFERKAFCSSVCFVGRISGMYSNFSPVEIRSRDTRICELCTTRDCLNGNDKGYPCPTGIDLGKLEDNTYCTMCTECFTTCPRHAPVLRIRPAGHDMSRITRRRMDEAWLALVLLSLTAFHGLSMTPVWQDVRPGTPDIVGWISGTLGVSELSSFTIGMAVVCALPVLAYVLSTWMASIWVRGSDVGFRSLFIDYAWSVLPVALFYHLAHNSMHLFMEGQDVVPALSDPLGRGWNLFGTAGMHMDPILGQNATWAVQVALVLVGHLFGVVVAHRISRRIFADKKQATRSLLPMLGMMVLLSIGGLWLMHLDMNMRMGRM